jgi:hypothetical protein
VYISLRHRIQTGSGTHSASSPKDIGGCFLGEKAAGAVILTTYLHLAPRLRMRGVIPPLPHAPSRRGA